MNKRGQFYLITAVFVILILFGTSSVVTYTSVKPEPKTITDISNDLNRETYKIVEYGIFNGVNREDLTKIESKFAGEDISKYIVKKSEDANIVFVYGDKNDINAISVGKENTGNIAIANSNFGTNNEYSFKTKPIVKDGLVKVKVLNKEYDFKIKENEMFYFLIVKEKDGEIFVERNEENKNKK